MAHQLCAVGCVFALLNFPLFYFSLPPLPLPLPLPLSSPLFQVAPIRQRTCPRLLKPENVLLDEAGRVWLADWGFPQLRRIADGSAGAAMTRGGTDANLWGAAGVYRAPEVLLLAREGCVTGRRAEATSNHNLERACWSQGSPRLLQAAHFSAFAAVLCALAGGSAEPADLHRGCGRLCARHPTLGSVCLRIFTMPQLLGTPLFNQAALRHLSLFIPLLCSRSPRAGDVEPVAMAFGYPSLAATPADVPLGRWRRPACLVRPTAAPGHTSWLGRSHTTLLGLAAAEAHQRERRRGGTYRDAGVKCGRLLGDGVWFRRVNI